MDVAHLYRNVGIGGVLRGVGVWLVMLGIGVHLVVRDGQMAPLVVMAGATILPLLLRRWLVVHLEISAAAIKYGGYAMFALAVSSPAWLDRITGTAHESIFATVLVGAAALYCTAWFAVCSDASVFTGRARSRREPGQ